MCGGKEQWKSEGGKRKGKVKQQSTCRHQHSLESEPVAVATSLKGGALETREMRRRGWAVTNA